MPRKLKLLMIASLAVICLPSPPLSTFAQPASTSHRPVAPPSKAAEGSPESAVAIEKAIEHGKAFLYAQQREGNWEESQKKMPTERGGQPGPMGGRGQNPVVTSQWGGLTSIAVFSLIAAGDNVRDERLTKAMAFIKTSDITGTYALGLHAQIWNLLPSNILKEYRANIQKDEAQLYRF